MNDANRNELQRAAKAAEAKLASISRTRRPTAAERAEALRAYIAVDGEAAFFADPMNDPADLAFSKLY